jgi:hypothetical protein
MTLSKERLKQLQLLNTCPQKLRKDLLKRVPSSCIKAICECSLNALKGNITLSTHRKNSLRKHKSVLRQLVDKKKPLFKKRKLIIQKGGFLNILIPAALTALTSLIHGVR